MRLAPFAIDPEELEKLRPHKGDIVTNNEIKYVVSQVGMKYFVCSPVDNPRAEVWFKHGEVTKWFPEDDVPIEALPAPAPKDEDRTSTFMQMFPKLKGRRT